MTVTIPVRCRRLLLRSGAVSAVVLIAACGSASTPSSGGGGAAGGPTINMMSTGIGAVLTGPSGNTMYVLVNGQGSPVPCTGSCLSAWPSVTITGTAAAGSGVTATLSTTSASGGTQLTVNNDPVYYFSGDAQPGQTNGEGIASFGGTWYALQPSGQLLKSSQKSSSSGSTSAPATSTGSTYGY